jgi:hypothetical protein
LDFELEEVSDLAGGVVFALVIQGGRSVGGDCHLRQREGWADLCVGGSISGLTTTDFDEARTVAERLAWSASADRAVPCVDPEASIRIGIGLVEAERTCAGIDGFREAFKDWLDPWEEYYVAGLETIDCGDRVLRLTEHTGRTRGSTSTVTLQAAEIATFRDGLIIDLASYPNRAEALKAAGMED